jgi:phage shock protein PspC (stress-responsive transcriptional regulator)
MLGEQSGLEMHEPLSKSRAVLTRPAGGRWLGGVCAALAKAQSIDVAWVRLGALLASLTGVGAIGYVACWLIMPEEGNEDAERPAPGIVVVAQGCAVCAGLALLGVVSAGATVFGLGWVVLGIAAALLIASAFVRTRWRPVWALLPVAALALPSVAVATAGLRLALTTSSSVIAPRALTAAGYQGGLGMMLVDLRHTSFPASGTTTMHIRVGVRRTIVALPLSTCVHVEVDYTADPFLGRLAALLDGRPDRPLPASVVFGSESDASHSYLADLGPASGPTLKLEVTSMGGPVYVRDYPDDVNPNLAPNWPGFRVYPEPRPSTRHLKRKLAQMELRAWSARHRAEVASERSVNAQMYGPCGAPPV